MKKLSQKIDSLCVALEVKKWNWNYIEKKVFLKKNWNLIEKNTVFQNNVSIGSETEIWLKNFKYIKRYIERTLKKINKTEFYFVFLFVSL